MSEDRKVYVICQNDFPTCVFDDKTRAERFLERRRAVAAVPVSLPVHWHMQEVFFNEGPGDEA